MVSERLVFNPILGGIKCLTTGFQKNQNKAVEQKFQFVAFLNFHSVNAFMVADSELTT